MTQPRVVGAGLCFLFIFLSGLRLSRSGKPFSSAILTIHKLIALAAAIVVVVMVYQMNQVAALSTVELAAGVITGLLFLGTGISGGLLSTDQPKTAAIFTVHRVGPYLTVLSTAATLYLLLGQA
jgi:DMSO reductase anchor subunit